MSLDECGALESVKAASELFCPVSGKITEKNGEVENTPGLINTSCYDKGENLNFIITCWIIVWAQIKFLINHFHLSGWLFKIELSKPEEMGQLMDEPAYEKFLKSQSDES